MIDKIPYDRLLEIAKKMHTYIFLNSFDEQKVYDEIGLTDEENCLLGYGGSFEVASNVLTTDFIVSLPAIDVSEISDGYHTFADLYEQRLILSAALAKSNPFAWKSKLHSDGTEPFGGGWFVMGWETEKGQYTYHYEMKDWELFECREIQRAPEWDGHTSKDVRRLLSMPSVYDLIVKHSSWSAAKNRD